MRKLYVPAILLIFFTALIWAVGSVAEDSSDQEPTFTFAVFGDNRPDHRNAAPTQTFRAILQLMNAFKPAFAVNTGDCIYGSSSVARVREQYKDYNDILATLFPRKTYLAIGNHEVAGGKACREFFEQELGDLYYSFDYADSHFIVLNSEVAGEEARVTGKQLEWLQQDLQKSRAARHKFVFLHRPLFPVDGHRGSCLDKYPKDRDPLHSLFVRNRITAVFVGHEHLLNVQKRNGVMYVITGGGGAFTYPSIEGEGDFHHFVLVSVVGDSVEMKVVKPGMHGKPQEVLPLKDFLKQ